MTILFSRIPRAIGAQTNVSPPPRSNILNPRVPRSKERWREASF